jgi:hypothetical protein
LSLPETAIKSLDPSTETLTALNAEVEISKKKRIITESKIPSWKEAQY